MGYVWLASLVIWFLAPGPVGLLLGRWWWPIAVGGVVAAFLFWWLLQGEGGGDSAEGIAWGVSLIVGVWGVVTAAVGVWIRKGDVTSAAGPTVVAIEEEGEPGERMHALVVAVGIVFVAVAGLLAAGPLFMWGSPIWPRFSWQDALGSSVVLLPPFGFIAACFARLYRNRHREARHQDRLDNERAVLMVGMIVAFAVLCFVLFFVLAFAGAS